MSTVHLYLCNYISISTYKPCIVSRVVIYIQAMHRVTCRLLEYVSIYQCVRAYTRLCVCVCVSVCVCFVDASFRVAVQIKVRMCVCVSGQVYEYMIICMCLCRSCQEFVCVCASELVCVHVGVWKKE